MERSEYIYVLEELKDKLEKKEIIAVQDENDTYMCPVCHQRFKENDIIKYSYKWCYNCGQRVDFTLPRNKFINASNIH